MLESIQSWIALIMAVFALIGLGIKLFVSLKALGEKEGWLKVIAKITSVISEAEQQSKDGAEKKIIVLNAMIQYCASEGIEFDEEKIGNYIDTCIAFANTIK